MTWEQLLKKVGEGKMPQVRLEVAVKYATDAVGTVTVIKDNGRHRGVGVQFPGLDYDTWFNEVNTGDKRSMYMDQLTIVD